MTAAPAFRAPPVAVFPAAEPASPLVLASPHGGRDYDPEFLAGTRLPRRDLRRLEDAYVDELFAGAPAQGAALVAARFPRAMIDANRSPLEIDPGMFAEPPPRWIDSRSPRVRAGLGLLPRRIPGGAAIYSRPLSRGEARQRLAECYLPYHRALTRLLRARRARFGYAVLIDCHSMPSRTALHPAGPLGAGARRGVDVVLGDLRGAACDPALTDLAEAALRGLGFSAVRNAPFAGGFTARRYGRPDDGLHALQIEIDRALYMDEERIARGPSLAALRPALDRLVGALAAFVPLARAAE